MKVARSRDLGPKAIRKLVVDDLRNKFGDVASGAKPKVHQVESTYTMYRDDMHGGLSEDTVVATASFKDAGEKVDVSYTLYDLLKLAASKHTGMKAVPLIKHISVPCERGPDQSSQKFIGIALRGAQ